MARPIRVYRKNANSAATSTAAVTRTAEMPLLDVDTARIDSRVQAPRVADAAHVDADETVDHHPDGDVDAERDDGDHERRAGPPSGAPRPVPRRAPAGR